ncbi:unnamed protein product [Hermetia illucens]|uniref:BTB domain-containing protein n=1 Tax=Hermetia illucens TaxID=343691 RepID=A0A7R8USQ2_HERIL|nr:unnamed protein product [Hermetia illucens]
MRGSLRVYPRGHSNADKNWLTLYFGLESKDVDIFTTIEVNVLTLEGNQVVAALTQEYQLIFSPDFMWATTEVAPTEVVLDSSQGFLLPNGALHIGLALSTHATEIPNRRLTKVLDQPISSRLRKKINQNTSKEDHDVEFLVGRRHYVAHRAVLVCSATFRALLSGACNSSEAFIKLPNVRPETFEELLIDCYVGSTRFCKKCFMYRAAANVACCRAANWRHRV